MNDLVTALHRISLSGGTNHQAGLERAYTEFTTNFTNIRDCQTTVVLITDGAPNAGGVNWDTIAVAANTLKNMTNNYGQKTRFYTLGLSIEHIGDNKAQLAAIANDGCSFNAERSTEVVDCITKIIEGMIVDANLNGNITDVLDPAFYPVDPTTGLPVESGSWVTEEGAVVQAGDPDAAGQILKENGSWKVVWENQRIDWPTYTDSTKTEILYHGWNGRVYVKSQEDFLGGNDISTNAEGSKAEALQYIHPDTDAAVDISEDDPNREKEFSTPYVNIDELAINENSTEWTVYLGESVDPRTAVENLLEEVEIYQVVTEDGSLVYTLNRGSTANPENKAKTGKTMDPDSLFGELTEENWDALIAGESIVLEYEAYGHTPGELVISLTQETAAEEGDLTNSPHDTAVTGEEVEKYTLTVLYEPFDAGIVNYHTGDHLTGSHGADTDDIESENEHVINVFAKGMEIIKTNDDFTQELTPAKFVLYRTAREDDDAEEVTEIEGAEGSYYPVAELDLSDVSSGRVNPLEKLSEGEQYFLVETESPPGFFALDHPLPVVIEITNSYVPLPGTESQTEKPDSGIYNWTQTAALLLGDNDSAVQRTDEEHSADLSHTAIIADSENSILYFKIANEDGYELPSAGGTGTFPYTLGGLMLMICSALMYGFRMRRGERRLN